MIKGKSYIADVCNTPSIMTFCNMPWKCMGLVFMSMPPMSGSITEHFPYDRIDKEHSQFNL